MMNELRGALQASLSSNTETRKRSEQVLKALETQPGYLSSMFQVALMDQEQASGAQELAAITLKHGCSKLWRHLSGEEKAHLKAHLLNHVDQIANDRAAVQLSLCIGRIARTDFPQSWQELFPSLVQKLGGDGHADVGAILSQNMTRRNLYVLHCVIKELASKRLPTARKSFQELSQQLMQIVWNLMYKSSEQLASVMGSGKLVVDPNHVDYVVMCQVWQLCIKCMKRLLVSGFPPDAKTFHVHPQFKEILPQMIHILKLFHRQYVSNLLGHHHHQQQSVYRELVLRGMLKIVKLFRDLVEVHPWSFSLLEVSAPVLEYIFLNVTSSKGPTAKPQQGESSNSLFVEEICTLCMSVLKSVMRSSAYRSSHSEEEEQGHLIANAQKLLNDFFSKERLDQMVSALISCHMVLNEEDLERWQVSPEEFHHENDLGNFNETLRSESEKLFCTFLETFKDQTLSTLTRIMEQVQSATTTTSSQSQTNSSSFESLLLKESLYTAMCLAAYDLHDFVNFQTFFESRLAIDFALQKEENRVIVRRGAYLLAAWVADVPDSLRPQVYHLLTCQLLPCEDMVIKLAACSVLRVFIDDWNFYEDQFQPYMQQALQHLLLIIQHAYDFDSQVQAFSVLCLILERMGAKVKPFAAEIVSMIPEVWQKAVDQSLLKIQVLNAMHRMMQCLGPASASSYNVVVPLLQYSVNPDGPESASILEDALVLLRSVLQFAVELHPQLAELVLFVTSHMQRSTEYLSLTSKVVEAYVLIGGLPFLQVHYRNLFDTLLVAINSINSRGMTMLTPVLDLILQIFPQAELAHLESIFISLMKRVLDEKESDEALIHIVCVFARLAVVNPVFLVQFIAKYSKEVEKVEETLVFSRLLGVWISKSYAITSSLKRKVLCAGLLRALDTNHPCFTSKALEIRDWALGSFPAKAQNIDIAQEWVTESAEEPSVASDDPEVDRRLKLWKLDPVNKLDIHKLVQNKFTT